MTTPLILNDPPYGSERSYNGLRLAKALVGKGAEVSVFLMADASIRVELVPEAFEEDASSAPDEDDCM